MNESTTLEFAGEQGGEALFRLSGPLDFAQVPQIHQRALAEFSGRANVAVDLSGVTNSNSAALALLIEWLRLARRDGRAFKLRNMPEALLKLARLSELEAFLTLA